MAVRKEFQIGKADVQFHPFWESENSAQSDNENVLVSDYSGKRGVLAVVANTGESEQSVTVDFQKSLNKSARIGKRGARSSEKICQCKKAKLRVTVPAKDFVLVRMAPPEIFVGKTD